jgi:hypothetical protein
MSASSTLLEVLHAIEKQNKPKKVAALHPTYSGGSGPAPYSHTKSIVQPKTSRGEGDAGGIKGDLHKGSGAILGVLGNLAGDVSDTVRGLPGGLIQTAHHPIATVEAVGKDYARRYSPLVHGDFSKFGKEIAAHPLAPLLDVATVATGGGAAVGKVAQSARIAKIVEKAGETANAAKAARVASKTEAVVKPAKAAVANLEKKAAVVKVDRTAAAERATGVAHPDRVAAAVKPFEQKIAKLTVEKTKVEKLAKRPGSSVATKAAHAANAESIGNVIKSVTRDMRAAKKAAKVLPVDITEAAGKAVLKHDATIASLQKQIVEHARTITKAEAKGAKKLAKPAELHGLPNMLARLQRIGEGGYRRIGADKGGVFKGIEVALHRNPVKRLRQNLGIDLQESRLIPQRTPLIGLESRAKKAANLQRDTTSSRIRATQRVTRKAIDHLEAVGKKTGTTGAMVTAAQAIIDGVSPADYARLVRDTRSTGDSIQQSIAKKMTQAEHHAQTEALVKPHLDKHAQELYVGVQQSFQREALAAGRQINPIHLQRAPSKLIDSPEVQAIVKLQKAHEAVAHDAMVQLVRNRLLKPDVASAQAVLHVNLVRAAKGQREFTPAEAKAVYEKAGLPAPSYNPDTLTIGDASKKTGMLKESKGKLYSQGTRVNNPMNIVMRHELASKATDVAMAHKLMLSAARHIPAGKDLPKGYIWIKDNVAPLLDQQHALFKNQFESDGVALGDDYFKLLETEKRPTGGFAVRKDVADDLAAGRKAMSAARADGAARAVQAWKYLVLVRPAFLLHNVLSNQAMYHLKNGWDFRAFHNMRAAFKSGAFDEHHHAEGLTFAEDVAGKGKSKISKAVHIFYKLTAQHEHWLRQLTAYETARKMPQVQRELRALKGGKYNPADHGGRTIFHEAYNRAVAKAPHVRDLVTRNMDDTLGNYRYYTAQERFLKNISPFYGWERHSTRNMIRMMEDNPATMAMVTQIGMVGHDKWNKDFGPGMPDFVRSYVQDSYIHAAAQALGMGNVSMYDFNSTNPWTTALDVGEAVGGNRDAAIGLAGPLVTGPYEALSKTSALTGAPSYSRFDKLGPVAGAIDRTVTSTPPVALWDALTSNKNENKKMVKSTDTQVVGRQVGLDFRDVDKKLLLKSQAAKTAPHDKYGHLIQKKKKKKLFYN